ncbi:MAG TPA: Ni/Fe hydrogenase subunit alpha [Candidatus Krumholzibacteria bacterium]|nr:Ni/Fe hydrogenase subunit alpha [Candidatus Krumholzibacteria bacterium]
MARTVTIDPVTRIEGHAHITIDLDDEGFVSDARFHVTQLRGFEMFCEGRPFAEMPSLMARICGICPVSHLVASSKACDALMAVSIPPNGARLRRLINLAQIVQSHALNFFHLSSPDLLLGMDSDPEKRNVFGVLAQHPKQTKEGIRLRAFGQELIRTLGGKRVHPGWVVPGGVSHPLEEEARDRVLAELPEMMVIVERNLDWFKGHMDGFQEEIRSFANFPSLFMALVDEKGRLDFYDGKLRFVNAAGNAVGDDVDPADYARVIAERNESDSYLKSPYYRPMGYPDGMYRVGPLARMNVVESLGTSAADQEWAEFQQLSRGSVLSSFHYHYARLIEILYCLERIRELLEDPGILDPHVRAHAEPNARVGVGASEAPRGTLFHHYEIDENGLMKKANLIIATGHNNLAMNRGVLQVAKHYINDGQVDDGALNRVEAVIRAFDPCLSCSTHALGEMPMDVVVRDAQGNVVDRKVRS